MAQFVENCIKKYLPDEELKEVKRILFGRSEDNEIDVATDTKRICDENNFEVRAFKFNTKSKEFGEPKIVRIGAIQHSIVLPTTDDVVAQRTAIFQKIEQFLLAAAASNVNIVCLAEAWNMPFGLCTQEKLPWINFAEDPELGPSTIFLKQFARKYNMVIISPILERDVNDVIWNTAVVISNSGIYLGKHRKYHLPSMNNRHNETTYYSQGNLGHTVFETVFGRIAVNICYGRHHPQHWMMFALNRADIVFNPSATISSFSSSIWEIEARNAAIANSFYTVAVNRVGCESFIVTRNGQLCEELGGPYNGSSYVTAPDGTRSLALSADRNGLLIADLDLNVCHEVKHNWGFRETQRLAEYGNDFVKAADPNFVPQIVRENP